MLTGFGLLLAVIVLGQLLDQGDVKEWLSEQSPGWAYLSIFLLVALDAVVPIFPGETTLSAASTIAADGGLQLELVMLAGALGAIVGDSSLFWIARRSSAKVKPQLDKAFQNEKIAVAWDMLQSSPGLLIVAGRYVPGMRFAVNASMGSRTCRTAASCRGPSSGGRSGRSTPALWPTTSRPRWPATQPHL